MALTSGKCMICMMSRVGALMLNERYLCTISKMKKSEGNAFESVIEGAEESHALLDPNALIPFSRYFDVRDEIRRMTRRR